MMIFIPVDDGTNSCAFLDTVCDKFVEAADGCHTFGSISEIRELEVGLAERLVGLVPEGYFERKSVYFEDESVDWNSRFTTTFYVGSEPYWFEWRPSTPVKLDRIEFGETLRFHGYANGNIPCLFNPPLEVKQVTRGEFSFGTSIAPPYGVVSLLLSRSSGAEEVDVEVVFYCLSRRKE